jgi:hypothetical protein
VTPTRPPSIVLGMTSGVTPWTRLTTWILGATAVAGTVGVGMDLAGLHTATRTALVLLFLAEVPTVAMAGLLRTFDVFARLVVACIANIAILALTAIVMEAEGVWSPNGGLIAVAGIAAVCLVAQWPPVRRRISAKASAWRTAAHGRRGPDQLTSL